MIEKIDIVEFLKTGNFGEFKELHFGMSRSKLTEVLGETEWKVFTRKKSEYASIYKYGKVEFYFEEEENGRLCGIQILPISQEAELINLEIDYEFIESNLDYESTMKSLEIASVNYENVESEFDSDEVRRILTEGGVQIIFNEGYFNKPNSLEKISKFITLDSSQSSRNRQVSFSIPETIYDGLKILSKEQRKSIKEICKEIIINKLGLK